MFAVLDVRRRSIALPVNAKTIALEFSSLNSKTCFHTCLSNYNFTLMLSNSKSTLK